MDIQIIIRIEDRGVAVDIVFGPCPYQSRRWRRASWTERRFAEALGR